MNITKFGAFALCGAMLTACATPQTPPKIVAVAPSPQAAPPVIAVPQPPVLKRKIAIGRFSNSTNYGRALLLDGQKDPLAEQASNMLMSRLVDTGQFIVLERGDIDAVKGEAKITGGSMACRIFCTSVSETTA